jgi:hypothetical protein
VNIMLRRNDVCEHPPAGIEHSRSRFVT